MAKKIFYLEYVLTPTFAAFFCTTGWPRILHNFYCKQTALYVVSLFVANSTNTPSIFKYMMF